MRTLLLYRPNSEHERLVLDYLRDFKMRTGKDLPTLDVDTKEGVQFCQTHDILQYPTIIVLDDDGHLQSMWSGEPLPQISEVGYYVQ